MRLQVRLLILVCLAVITLCTLFRFPECLSAQNHPNLTTQPPNRASWLTN